MCLAATTYENHNPQYSLKKNIYTSGKFMVNMQLRSLIKEILNKFTIDSILILIWLCSKPKARMEKGR